MKSPSHKVYINDTLLCFTLIYDPKKLAKADGKFVSDSQMDIKDVIDEIEKKPESDKYFYLSSNPDSSWQIFLSYYTLIEAAGGIVQNEEGEYLVIFRRGKWDLPKGKLDYDETPEQCALREVEEECGVKGLKIIKEIAKTFHTYELKSKDVLKKTHWYLMEYNGDEEPTPQTEEDIEEAQWMDKKLLKNVFFENTYKAMKDLLNETIGVMKK